MCLVYVPMFLLWFKPFLPHSQIGNIGFHIEKQPWQKIASENLECTRLVSYSAIHFNTKLQSKLRE
jgi:hypothetical protein